MILGVKLQLNSFGCSLNRMLYNIKVYFIHQYVLSRQKKRPATNMCHRSLTLYDFRNDYTGISGLTFLLPNAA